MFDVALSSAGAQIALATSSDDKHPPEHMIDGNSLDHLKIIQNLQEETHKNQNTKEEDRPGSFRVLKDITSAEESEKTEDDKDIEEVPKRWGFMPPLSLCAVHIQDMTAEYHKPVRKLKLEASETEDLSKYDTIAETELEETDSQLQQEEIQLGEKKAHCLRIIIESGYDHFVSLHKVVVSGQAMHQ